MASEGSARTLRTLDLFSERRAGAVLRAHIRASAELGADSITDMLRAQGLPVATHWGVNPSALTENVRFLPLSGNRTAVKRELATALHDAFRQGGALMMFDTQTTTYIRALTPPSCPDCTMLAGRVERGPTPFRRHPNCDCIAVPTTSTAKAWIDPQQYFNSLSSVEQDRIFGKARAAAIRAGANMNRVINAYRKGKTYVAQHIDGSKVRATRELAKRGQVRLLPEAIMQIARNQAELVSLLKQYRYII